MIDPASSPAFIFCLFQLDLYTPSKKCATRDKNNIHHAPLSTQESMCAVLYPSFAQVLAPLGTCNHLIDHPYHLQRQILLMFEQNHPPRTYQYQKRILHHSNHRIIKPISLVLAYWFEAVRKRVEVNINLLLHIKRHMIRYSGKKSPTYLFIMDHLLRLLLL